MVSSATLTEAPCTSVRSPNISGSTLRTIGHSGFVVRAVVFELGVMGVELEGEKHCEVVAGIYTGRGVFFRAVFSFFVFFEDDSEIEDLE